MTNNLSNKKDGTEFIQFRMHPRVFTALGADLVTNDVVAVIELVKNSYDAMANNVWIRMGADKEFGPYMEIIDDGIGMTRQILEDVWCLVATPYKEDNPLVAMGQVHRRVVGEKGLGRLSVARLGRRLVMLTQARNEPCWEIDVDWSEVSAGKDISNSYIKLREKVGTSPFDTSGTRLRILGLKGSWDDLQLTDLEDNLARLVSPFSELADFNIFLAKEGDSKDAEIKIEPARFLAKPKYSIRGVVDDFGNISAKYTFSPLASKESRRKDLSYSWERVFSDINTKETTSRFVFSPDQAHCGGFSFEIRAWDIGPEDTHEIAEHYEFQKNQVRKAIRAHKGVSVYRDSILVLPKSENARDWLGLDLRRVSKVGTRLSTSQIVGYVTISSEKNPRLQDTSDRERLVSCLEVAEFEEILKAIVALMENERENDRVKPERETPIQDLFEGLTAEALLAEVAELSEEGSDVSDALPLVKAFNESLISARNRIQERFTYYSRMAAIGTLVQMLVHEIRNRTTAFGSFLDFVKNRFGPFKDPEFDEEYRSADKSMSALEKLADTFAPLANRGFKRKKRSAVVEEQITDSLALCGRDIQAKKIACRIPSSHTVVAVDPGELDAILLNLILNSIYWLGQAAKNEREIDFRILHIDDGRRVRIWIHDTGPGIDPDDADRIFWPGVTRKPEGIGMGLTVASELVAAYGGKMFTKHPGTRGGASFAFDLPIRK